MVLTYIDVSQIVRQIQCVQNPDLDPQTLKFLQGEFLYKKNCSL